MLQAGGSSQCRTGLDWERPQSSPSSAQGQFSPFQAAPNPIQPGFGNFQGCRENNFPPSITRDPGFIPTPRGSRWPGRGVTHPKGAKQLRVDPCSPPEPWSPPFLAAGSANFECKGRVWIEPAPVVPMGSDVSIGCQSTVSCPSSQRLLILVNLNLTEGSPAVPGSAARLRLRDFRVPFATVTCISRCDSPPSDKVVCGTELRAGCECPPCPPSPGELGFGCSRALIRPRPPSPDPPDPPGNLSCAIAEGSERLECGWDGGRVTHLHTRNSLHLRR